MRSENSKKSSRSRRSALIVFAAIVFIGVPAATIAIHASKTGQNWSDVLRGLAGSRSVIVPPGQPSGESTQPGLFAGRSIGTPARDHPRIAHVEAADLDRDGLLDVIVCDALINSVTWIRQSPRGEFNEQVIGPEILAPAHTQAMDIDGDGDLDILVASLGSLPPSNERIGSVVILENDGQMNFIKHVVADRIARVADVRGGDLDGDGDIDLIIAQFGADDGETSWMENLGEWNFALHTLQTLNGTINCEIVDMDGDDDLDIVTVVSQEWEEIYLFLNDGAANFSANLVYRAGNDDYGSSGISVADLDGDGDLDVLYTNGDAFDYTPPRPRPWHGVQWLENRGDGAFVFHRLADFPGAYSPRTLDFDGDGDFDIVAVSGFNRWEKPTAQSLLLLENLGAGRFVEHGLATNPTHLVTINVGDFNGDGRDDLVTGGVHFYAPYDRLGRITIWMNSAKPAVAAQR